jgi:hypothetical protein
MTHKPCPTRTIDSDLVRMLLDSQANQFVSIEFYKVNGELSSKNGQLKASSRLVGNARGAAQSDRMKDAGQVWLALSNGKSASFYLDRVVAIRGKGLNHRVAGV